MSAWYCLPPKIRDGQDVFDPFATGEDVEGDVQDMVGFVIGEVTFEDVKLGVDVADQAGRACQEEHGTDAAGREALDSVGQLIVDVCGGDHGLVAFGSLLILDALEDSVLAFAEDPALPFSVIPGVAFSGLLGDSGTHSKASVDWNCEDVFSPLLFQNLRGFSSFFR
jgi:hypothetical protein